MRTAACVLLITLAIPIAAAPALTATKAVDLAADGSALTYTITITNTGPDPQPDTASYELVDNVPATVVVTQAIVVSGGGTPTFDFLTNTLYWDGVIPAGGSIVISIDGHVKSGAPSGTTISNQGTAFFDTNGDGTNDASVLTDDPSLPGSSDPTSFVVPSRVIHATLAMVELTPDPVLAGSGPANLVYRVTVTALATNERSAQFVIADALPSLPGVTFDTAITASGTWDPGAGQWTTDFLLPGQSATLDLSLTVAGNATPGTDVLSNTASFLFGSWEFTPGPSVTETTSVSAPATVDAIPTLHPLALVTLLALLGAVALRALKAV